jgi:hypothetical protein
MTTFYCLKFESLQPEGPGPRIYMPQEQGSPWTYQYARSRLDVDPVTTSRGTVAVGFVATMQGHTLC